MSVAVSVQRCPVSGMLVIVMFDLFMNSENIAVVLAVVVMINSGDLVFIVLNFDGISSGIN